MAPPAMVTCRTAANIAVVKYWGKRDERLMLPLNDSVSCTLESDVAGATTTISADPSYTDDKLWLNGREEIIPKRVFACVERAKQLARFQNSVPHEVLSWNLRICSVNNFPTAAGLASSAAGYGCLATALCRLYKIKGDISAIARLGSGSASRSVTGGFVQWHAGTDPNGDDSIATQIAPSSHWPQIRLLILVVSDERKKTSSSDGMRNSIKTSDLLKTRVDKCVPERVALIKKAISERNFHSFAEITMKESNQFHAVCLDTFPPCVYMNDVSHSIVEAIHSYNAACGENKIAYTFDAGPNACLYMLEDQIPYALSLVKEYFPSDRSNDVEYIKGMPIDEEQIPASIKEKMNVKPYVRNSLKYLIHTKVGDGPVELSGDCHLLDEKGFPKTMTNSC